MLKVIFLCHFYSFLWQNRFTTISSVFYMLFCKSKVKLYFFPFLFLPWISTYPKQFSSLERGITKLSGMPTSPEFVLLVQAINSNIVISFFNCANAVGSSLTFNLSERKVCQFDFGSDHKLVWKVRCIHEPLRLINRFYNVLRKNKKKVEFT